MTNLCPGPIFPSTGFNQTYTPVGIRASSADIHATYNRYVHHTATADLLWLKQFMNIIFWLKFDYGNFPFRISNFALNMNKNVQNTQTSADDNYANTINAIET